MPCIKLGAGYRVSLAKKGATKSKKTVTFLEVPYRHRPSSAIHVMFFNLWHSVTSTVGAQVYGANNRSVMTNYYSIKCMLSTDGWWTIVFKDLFVCV